MKVSVIIPVYNAAAYVGEAVASALEQPETGEVLLIEDGSTDGSLRKCEQLATDDDRVVLLRHADGVNAGAGASRNLGIAAAKCPLVAFLDADDYYLPHRFEKALEVLGRNPDADGVYETTGVTFQDDRARRRWKDHGWPDQIGLRRYVDPSDLFETLVAGGSGSFHTDGIVVRRALFEKSGGFNPDLRTGQDTHLWVRMAAVGQLYPGCADRPVSMCRIHAGNRVSGRPRNVLQDGKRLLWADLIRWGRDRGVPGHLLRLVGRRYALASWSVISQRRLFDASRVAARSCGLLIRYCPRPWKVEGFFRLLGATFVVCLALRRAADYPVRGVHGRGGGIS
jgi:glycosyltransferase involved in cell wall biosynthesis